MISVTALILYQHACHGLNSYYFHIIGDELINPIVGVYRAPWNKDSVIKGGEGGSPCMVGQVPVPDDRCGILGACDWVSHLLSWQTRRSIGIPQQFFGTKKLSKFWVCWRDDDGDEEEEDDDDDHDDSWFLIHDSWWGWGWRWWEPLAGRNCRTRILKKFQVPTEIAGPTPAHVILYGLLWNSAVSGGNSKWERVNVGCVGHEADFWTSTALIFIVKTNTFNTHGLRPWFQMSWYFRRWKITSLPTSLGSEVVTRCCGDYLVRPWFGDEMMREGIRPRFCFESRIKDECQDNINDTTV